ncbi:glycosyltransferase WbuB [Corynebacterium genitalium]|nr:glycosyltransferase WbuB [Corynebacterium genitalium]
MKILIVSQYWFPENGVPQRRWQWLSQILTEAGHDVMVIAPPPHYQRKVTFRDWVRRKRSRTPRLSKGASGELIYRSAFLPEGQSLISRVFNQAFVAFGMMWVALRSSRDLRDVDVVVGTVPALPTAPVAAAVSRLIGAPYLIDLRDAWPDLLEEASNWNRDLGKRSLHEKVLSRGPLQAMLWLARKVIDRVLERAQGILVTSEFLREQLLHQLGSSRRDIATIRNVFPPETSLVRDGWRAPKGGRINVLYAGTLGRAQNLGNAIAAASLVAERGIEINLRLVGAGVARKTLSDLISDSRAHISIEDRRDADALGDCYQWADTALVHLTDWEPLSRAVPSKTYELMELGIHISGVVAGETAELIEKLGAGDVVEPESPSALADLWYFLAMNPDQLRVSADGASWVRRERNEVVPPLLIDSIAKAKAKKHS